MSTLLLPIDEPVYRRHGNAVVFNQLALKIEMDTVPDAAYFSWLDSMAREIRQRVPGARIVEKADARTAPPLNTAVYYDTSDHAILPTGALLRTSCNKRTHAFCAFKERENQNSVRRDHRWVFEGAEKAAIQADPTSARAVAVVRRLLARTEVEHPGLYLRRALGIDPRNVFPALGLDDLRHTFFVWLDGRDALRCSLDRAMVWDLRSAGGQRMPVGEVELAVYPRLSPDVARDPRLPRLIAELAESLMGTFAVPITRRIKYQRAAAALGIRGGRSE